MAKTGAEGVAYTRGTGELGIVISIYEATPTDQNQKHHGSSQFFLMGLNDKLTSALSKVPLHRVKGAFEKKNMLHAVYFAGFKAGGVLVTDFESVEGLEQLWTAYKKGTLGPMLQEILVTPGVLKELKTKSLKIRAVINEQDYKTCRGELLAKKMKKVTITDSDADISMLQHVNNYRKQLMEKILQMRDELARFDQNMGEFLLILKQNIPDSLQEITTLKQYDEIQKRIRKVKPKEMKPFDYYIITHQNSKRLLEDMEKNICHPLCLVHTSCETAGQQTCKHSMKEKCLDMQRRLRPEYNFTKLKHSDVQSKILLREQDLFLGLVSVLHFAVETIVDIDHLLDEYMSAIDIKLRD